MAEPDPRDAPPEVPPEALPGRLPERLPGRPPGRPPERLPERPPERLPEPDAPPVGGRTPPTPAPAPRSVRSPGPGAVKAPHPLNRTGVGGDLRAVAALAGRQRGIITRRQLRSVGLSPDVIDRMVRGSQLHSIHRGVYALGHRALAPHAAEVAGLFAVAGDVVLSHVSANEMWGLPEVVPGHLDVHVTVVGRRSAQRVGLRVHRTARLETRDRRRVDGLPVTSPARTLCDLADLSIVKDWRLERSFGEALTRRLVTLAELDDVLARANGRHGVARFARLIDMVRADGPTRTRSDAEAELLGLIRAARLPAPRVNARICGYEVDFLWPAHRLVLELDGFRYHSTPLAADRDHRKTQALTAAGLAVMRASPRQAEREPLALIARLAMALAAAEAPEGRRPTEP